MFKKIALLCFAIMTMISVEARSDGLLGRQYLGLGFQIGEFGNDSDQKAMDKTKGVIAAYNHPVWNNIDIGASVEFNQADGEDTVDNLNYNLDFKIGGIVTYATLFTQTADKLRLFVRPQIGWQKTVTEWRGGGEKRSEDENDLFMGLDCGLEYDFGRFFLVPALGVSHADETNINGKFTAAFNIADNVVLTAGTSWQLNHDHDYLLNVGFALRF